MSMTNYKVDVYIHGLCSEDNMKSVTDTIFDALAERFGLDDHTLGVEVEGPPELNIVIRDRRE
jgi:hypothetical protein